VARPFSFSVFSVCGIYPASRNDNTFDVNGAVSELPGVRGACFSIWAGHVPRLKPNLWHEFFAGLKSSSPC